MHREIQIKQFPIVTTHWWPKTRNEQFVWENEQYLYRFLPLVHNHPQVIWVRTRIRCVTCVRALWLTLHSHGASTLDGGRAFSHKPLVSCLRPSMCSYDGELFNLDFSVHVLFPSYRDSDLYLPLYDWQTRTVWPKNIKIGSTEEKKTPTSWMPLG